MSDSEAETDVTSESTQRHLDELKETLVDGRPPFCSGAIAVDPKNLLLFYSNGPNSGRIDFSNATDADLAQLMQACDPAKFGHGNKDVYDESVRKAGKLDSENFALSLDIRDVRAGKSKKIDIIDAIYYGLLRGNEIWKQGKYSNGEHIKKEVVPELYKLNVYGKDGFFKGHKDTPRGTDMFGSLVIVLPTPHVGGELIFRHNSREWKFDSAAEIAKLATTPSIAYTAFYSDVEHEVLPVKEGYRVTITYNLYYKKLVEKPIPRIPTQLTIPPTAEAFKMALEKSLADEEFMSDGGMLGFELQHLYPMLTDRWAWRGKSLEPHLKGVDALILSACIEAGLRTRICFLYEDALLLEDRLEQDLLYQEGQSFLYETLALYGGTLIGESWRLNRPSNNDCAKYKFQCDTEPDLTIHSVQWVTDSPVVNKITTDFLEVDEGYFGNEAGVQQAYASFVLIADVGKPGERKTYFEEKITQLDEFRKEMDEEEENSDLASSEGSELQITLFSRISIGQNFKIPSYVST